MVITSAKSLPIHLEPQQIQLTEHFTGADYEKWRDAKPVEQKRLLALVRAMFHERYVSPAPSGLRGRFISLAISCVLIETFWQLKGGWKSSEHRSQQCFVKLFESTHHLASVKHFGREFYQNVRCELLHQGELTNGWRLSDKRQAKLLNTKTKEVDARGVFEMVVGEIDAHLKSLEGEAATSTNWKNLLKRMDHIVESRRGLLPVAPKARAKKRRAGRR